MFSCCRRGFASESDGHLELGPDEIEAKGIKLQGAPVYLDAQATTPLDPRVLDEMLPHLTYEFGNPHSRTHVYGWEAEAAVETARARVAELIGAHPKEIVFTSGATEANNLAIKGVAGFYGSKKKHIVTCQTDHKCVLDSCRSLQSKGFEVTYLPVRSDGLVDLELLKETIRPGETALVSVMAANNEIGAVQDVAAIGAICRERGAFFHTDAAQAVGKVPVDVDSMNIDLLSLSGHKLYGPKGIGALYVRRRPRVRLEAQMSGGGQERGLRSGTVPTPLVVGLGAAAELAAREMAADSAHTQRLARRLIDGITGALPGVVLNGPALGEMHREESGGGGGGVKAAAAPPLPKRLSGCVNLSFAYVEGESLLMGLKDLAVSSGSACTSASLEPSYVLRALGVDEEMAHTSVRFGLGRFTTEAEVDRAVALTVARVGRLRELSPLWELAQEGVDLKTIQWSQH